MRAIIRLILGALMVIGATSAARAATFDLRFAAPGADCATDQPVDCNAGDIIEADGDLHFDIEGDEDLLALAFSSFDVVDNEADAEFGVAIQDYPEMGGLAVLSTTDQVEAGEALAFVVGNDRNAESFTPFSIDGISFFDDHMLPNPETLVQVWALFGDTWETDSFSIGELEGGELAGLVAQAWVFQGLEGEETWYISALSGTTTVPEPGTALLVGLGVMGLASRRSKRV